MNTVQVKAPRWIGGYALAQTPWSTSQAVAEKPAAEVPAKSFQLTAEESTLFLGIVSACGRIRRHYDIYRWLTSDVQHFLPHEILLSAWGDFGSWDLKLDITSALPGVRTGQLAHCR